MHAHGQRTSPPSAQEAAVADPHAAAADTPPPSAYSPFEPTASPREPPPRGTPKPEKRSRHLRASVNQECRTMRIAVHEAMFRQLFVYSSSSRSRMLSSDTLSSVSRFYLLAKSFLTCSFFGPSNFLKGVLTSLFSSGLLLSCRLRIIGGLVALGQSKQQNQQKYNNDLASLLNPSNTSNSKRNPNGITGIPRA